MKRKWPKLDSDEAAERFVAEADLTEYDFSQMIPMRFEIAPKSAVMNMRLPAPLLAAVKAKARAQGLPYARYVRMVLEADLRHGRS